MDFDETHFKIPNSNPKSSKTQKSGPKPTLTKNSETYSLKFSGINSSEIICDAFDTHDTHVTCESACDRNVTCMTTHVTN